MAVEAGGDVRAGIGSRLRSARERKGLTILQAAEKLHVDAKILESLEAEDFAALGAPVYARGHLRHYAELVGEPPAELQELYSNSNRAAQAQPDLTRISRARPTSDPGKLVMPAVVVLVGIGLIGTVWWILTLSRDKSHVSQGQVQGQAGGVSANATAEPAAAASADSAAPANGGDGSTAPANTSDLGATSNSAPTPGSAKQSGTAGVPKTVAKNSAVSATPAKQSATARSGTAVPNGAAGSSGPATHVESSAVAATGGATTSSATPSASHIKDAEVTLKFSADSWAEVYDASGQRLFYDVGAASSAHTVKGPAPLRIILGNAAGVAVEVNGHTAAINTSVLPDGSAQFSINARGRAVRAKPADGG